MLKGVAMRQTELKLSARDRSIVEEVRSKGVHRAREVNRAHVLWCLDHGLPEAQIMAVLGVGRTAVNAGQEPRLFDGEVADLFVDC